MFARKRSFGPRPSSIPEDPKAPRSSTDRSEGDAARSRREWRKAAEAYERHLARHTKDFAIWVQLGHMRKEAGEPDQARAAYDCALAMDPDDSDLHLNYGHLLKDHEDLAGAAAAYRLSFAIDANAQALRELTDARFSPHLFAAERAALMRFPISVPLVAGRLETIENGIVTGWAIDELPEGELPELQFFQEGKLIGSGRPTIFRQDLLVFGYRTGAAGFRCELDIDFSRDRKVMVSARFARTGQTLANSPLAAVAPAELGAWLQRGAKLAGDELALVRERARCADGKRLSIVMPVYETRPEWLREAVDSVLAQWCDAWELVCVDDASPSAHVRTILDEYAERDARVRIVYLNRNLGIAGATNRAMAAATGDYIGFLDHDDMLEPDAVARMLEAAEHGPGLIYSDEALTGASIHNIRGIVARPAFSYDYYLSHPYFVHFIAVRRDIIEAVGGLDESMSISADVDFVLRVLEHAGTVAHVPAVLYRWRTHVTSTGHTKKTEVTAATLGALNRHLARTGQMATANAGLGFNGHQIDYADDPAQTIVIIPTKNRRDLLERAISSIRRTTDASTVHVLVIDHASSEVDFMTYMESLKGQIDTLGYSGPFNFARMNNLAVRHAGDRYRYIVFCNNDIEALEPGWIEHMRSLCARDDVGIVGATLLYPNDSVQHAGVTLGLGGTADHAHKFRPYKWSEGDRNLGYNFSLGAVREYSAVTAACLMMRRSVFEEVGGFDESFEIGFNDTDLCLRVGEAGYKVLNDPFAVLYHHESATRTGTAEMEHPKDAQRLRRRWSSVLAGRDPFYSPLLKLQPGSDHGVAEPDSVYSPPRIRPVGMPKPAKARPSS